MSTETANRVREAMTSPVETTVPDATVAEASKHMREEDINSLLVLTDPPSIVTSSDVLDAVSEMDNPGDSKVIEIATESVETIPPTIPTGEARAMMENFGINHLPVVEQGDYIGMLSSTDLGEQF